MWMQCFFSGLAILTVFTHSALAASCEISVEGEVAFSGECYVQDLGAGDFSFRSSDGSAYAITSGIGSGMAVGEASFDYAGRRFEGSIGSLYPGGDAQRDGCWGNRSVDICVFSDAERDNAGSANGDGISSDRPFSMAEIQRDFSRLSSEDLVLIQSLLQRYGLYQSRVDGLWGAGTAQALYDAQANFAEGGWRIGDDEPGEVPASYVDFVYGKAVFAAYD